MNLGFQRKTDLAMRVMQRLGSPGVKRSGAELSASIGTTAAFLPQVIAPLIDNGWITSERGPGGGYALTEASVDVSLFDILEATQGPTVDGRCVLRDQPCPGSEACDVHAAWTAAREVFVERLREIPAIPAGEMT